MVVLYAVCFLFQHCFICYCKYSYTSGIHWGIFPFPVSPGKPSYHWTTDELFWLVFGCFNKTVWSKATWREKDLCGSFWGCKYRIKQERRQKSGRDALYWVAGLISAFQQNPGLIVWTVLPRWAVALLYHLVIKQHHRFTHSRT